jgi:quercetin dioxygenase-like cupin family protein/iron-sulfur cluster repair protein YtfE (RIC family)
VQRHAALVPLSHDHHHALVEARKLRRAADGPEPAAAAADFLRFFDRETARHFREEEELLFPAAVGFEEAREPLLRTLFEHQRLRALAAALRDSAEPSPDTMRELGDLLHDHVRHEERVLFPLLEKLLGDSGLSKLPLGDGDGDRESAAGSSGGPVWSTASEDLNATLVEWRAGKGPPEHVNEERDVLVTVLDGSAVLLLDGEEHRLDRGQTMVVGKGAARRITAGPEGVRYLSVHLRRPGLQVSRGLRSPFAARDD